MSLGKEGLQNLAVWGTDIRNALEHKVGQYTAIPSNVDLGRRNTILGVESTSNGLVHLRSVEEEDENSGSRGLSRDMSTRSLGLRADVPHNVDTARSSVASIGIMQPPSAASTITLFEEFEAELQMQSGPQAESTPHNTVSQKLTSRHPPPPMPQHRHSTIRYIKSETVENAPVTYPLEESSPNYGETATSAMSSIVQWSTRAVRPLIPKASKLSRSPSDPKEGLRTLTLLQDRGNVVKSNTSPTSSEIRPLALVNAKEKKSRRVNDENANVGGSTSGPRNKNLKSLTLVRSETSKMRGILRKTEVLPDVVVRPPSLTEHNTFSYSFRDRD